MIFMPPQHGKSELVSVRLPPFWFAHHPNLPVLLTSYASGYAESKSILARSVIESEEYVNLFPDIALAKVGNRADEWHIANPNDPRQPYKPYKGYLRATGVGGAITGHGVALGIIDDPVENWEQAQSPTYRKKTWEWYRTTFRTRIWENGSIVIIMTRWHKYDLAGMLLDEQAEDWEVYRIPALAESQEERDKNNEYLGLPTGQPDLLNRTPGEPLAPKLYSLGALQSLKKDVGVMGWSAEYQGVPRASEGNRFKYEWFEIIDRDKVPADALKYGVMIRYWDNAATQDGGCYTAGVLLCLYESIGYILDCVRGQWSSDNRNRVMKTTAALDRETYKGRVQIWFEKEGGSSGVDVAHATIKMLVGYPVHADNVTGDKDVRLMPFESQCEAGNIKLVKGKWNKEYIDEFLEIPNGSYRDQSDATSGAYNKAALGIQSAESWTTALKRRKKDKENDTTNDVQNPT